MNIDGATVKITSPEVDTSHSPSLTKPEEVKQPEKSSSVMQLKERETKSKEDAITEDEAEVIVDTLNEYTNVLQTKLGFSINKQVEKIVVTVRNKETDEIIRQIPAEELLLIQEKMEELTGLLLNKKV